MRFRMMVAFVIGWAILTSVSNAQSENANKPENGLARLTAGNTTLKQGDKIAIFGDSITMQGGHIQLIDAALKGSDHTKELGIQLLPHGLNGGRVPTVIEGKSPWGDLGAPMQSLLETEKPTIVVIHLGINDVWHEDKGTTKEEFEAGLQAMIKMARDVNAKIVLCTPSVIGEEKKDNKFNEGLSEYAAIIRELAKAEKLVLCDIHQAFLAKLESVNKADEHQGNLTYDGVHMNEQGNALLAEVIAESIRDAASAE
jgi:isoamyl acetate esterase